ncbi:MAG: hypothetical protein IJX25_00160 [Clostridia bacterium]|nr:hypothetical protein [Clostridia bacterium]
MIKCENCKYCKFEDGNGRPGRYYCLHRENPSAVARTASYKLICKTERRETAFTIKKTPKWCPEVKDVKN